MVNSRSYLLLPLFLTVALNYGMAHSYGPPPRVTGAPGDDVRACTQCHAGSPNTGTGSVRIVLQSGNVYIPGVKQRVIVQVADAAQQRWGFELTARLNSDAAKAQAGDFTPVDNFTQVICEDAGAKPCLTGVSFIQHSSAGTRNGTKGGASFQFDWTPPATNAGPVTLYVAGNAANGNGSSAGDFIYTSSVQLTPVAAAPPVITSGNIVSSATSLAGPMGANSWVTVYGSGLSATTRSWLDSDFTNGGMPTSLDGVSVVLTAFGAPRLASVGYVSPTQVNFLLPSDVNSTTVQVQLKNAAGITAQNPITTQANTAQLLTLDGKYGWAAHADGSLIGKSGTTPPAVPGETISLYATGCGPTTPALIPGQLPAQVSKLVTPPSVTIGGLPATVVSATAVIGSGGVYQLVVQVPAAVLNGDQPVVVQLGTNSSSAALITIQR